MTAFEDFVNTELPLRAGISSLPTASNYPRFTGIGRGVEERTPAQVLADIVAAAASHTHTESEITDLAHTAPGGPGTDTTAIHDDTASEITAVAENTTPHRNDEVLTEDSQAANVKKSVKFDNIPGIIPIRGVIDWAKSLGTGAVLPWGWVQCDGQILSDADSPLDGEVIPNINGSNQFTRGNSTSGGTGGESTHTLTTPELASHKHSPLSNPKRNFVSDNASSLYNPTGLSSMPSGLEASTNIAGGNVAHENKPPYINMVKIMRVK